jgi:hypothetical protein
LNFHILETPKTESNRSLELRKHHVQFDRDQFTTLHPWSWVEPRRAGGFPRRCQEGYEKSESSCLLARVSLESFHSQIPYPLSHSALFSLSSKALTNCMLIVILLKVCRVWQKAWNKNSGRHYGRGYYSSSRRVNGRDERRHSLE